MSETTLAGRGASPAAKLLRHHRVTRQAGLQAGIKRAIDILGAGAILLLILPLMALIILAIRRDGGPALFSHPRIGLGGRSFGCLKFRSMVTDADARLAKLLAEDPAAAAEWAVRRKLARDPRITRIGAFLRSTSL
ncbi:MAG: sugar transferase, partial [Paracraurococcus sp.]